MVIVVPQPLEDIDQRETCGLIAEHQDPARIDAETFQRSDVIRGEADPSPVEDERKNRVLVVFLESMKVPQSREELRHEVTIVCHVIAEECCSTGDSDHIPGIE